MTRYGVANSYEGGRAAKSDRLIVWSGSFFEAFEAEGRARDGARRITLTTYNGDKVIVKLPHGLTFPRDDENYRQIDEAISAALDKHYAKRGDASVHPDLPAGHTIERVLHGDDLAPGADDE